MRATIRIAILGLSLLSLTTLGCVTGSHCLHRPCGPDCAESFKSPSPFATSKTARASFAERVRRKLDGFWGRDEAPRDVTVRPESTPIPGARALRRAPRDGVLDLPAVVEEGDDCGE